MRKIRLMIDLNDSDYKNIAEKLLAAIGCSEYYNGALEYDTADYNCVLRATLIIYRQPLLDPADASQAARSITDIVPVWWEFHLYDVFGEQLNGFSWRELKEYLI